jgi:hypothetical protein
VDGDRLAKFFGWANGIDSSAFNDRTTVILGDNKGQPTYAGAEFEADGTLQPSADGLAGDGTVPHSCAVLPATTTYLAPGTEHPWLPTYRSVLAAVRAVLKGQAADLPTASSNPADHLTPLIFPKPEAVESFAATAAVAAARPITGTVTAEGMGMDKLARIARLVGEAATATGARVRQSLGVDRGRSEGVNGAWCPRETGSGAAVVR